MIDTQGQNNSSWTLKIIFIFPLTFGQEISNIDMTYLI